MREVDRLAAARWARNDMSRMPSVTPLQKSHFVQRAAAADRKELYELEDPQIASLRQRGWSSAVMSPSQAYRE